MNRNSSILLEKSAAGLVALLSGVCMAMPLHAAEGQPLQIAILESKGDSYVNPVGRRLVIRSQPFGLFVRIRNTSEVAVQIRAHPENAYSIELTNEAGVTVVVKRKKGIGGDAEDDVRDSLPAGADRFFAIHWSRATWDGVPDLEAGKESKFTARIVYVTADGKTIYSEPYTLIFNILE